MKQPFTFLIHIALAVILAGAIITHFFGIQGILRLDDGALPVNHFTKKSGPGTGEFPFSISLKSAEVEFYPGTTTPMDYKSVLLVDGREVPVSMNKVADVDGWRFFQSGMRPTGSTLAVSYDPWGVGVTYFGYALLFIGIVGYFFQRRTPWRLLLRKRAVLGSALLLLSAANAYSALPAMQRPLAANFGKAYVYWNDRICPLQTMARDVTIKLYGSDSYQGLTAEQVLSGWLFYYDEWERDWLSTHRQRPESERARKKLTEKESVIQWLGTGDAFKIYPYKAAGGYTEWLSLTGRKPSGMDLEQWQFMQTTMPRIKQLLLSGKNIAANEQLDSLVAGQVRYAGCDVLPSATKMQAERIYNVAARPLFAAIFALLLGAVYFFLGVSGKAPVPWLRRLLFAGVWLVFAYMAVVYGALWWLSGHLPMSNGPETMLFMAVVALLGTLLCRASMLRGALLFVAAMTLFVAVMGGHSPRIGALMPVLASPLLSIHVMLVMVAYVLFLLMAILSAAGLLAKADERKRELWRTNMLLLTPAVCLLAAGIFVGAIWANQSWGRYWGWDPKETCALVMLFVYAVPVHWASRPLAFFRRPKVLHVYLLAAILTVVFTYFGANYILPGLHSYA